MINKIKNLSMSLIIVCAVMAGSLAGGSVALAHDQGPFDLPAGWSYLQPYGVGHVVTGYYSFLQNAYLYSSDDDIYVDWVRQWGGVTVDEDTEYEGTYMWTDNPYDYELMWGYAGNLVQGFDYTAHYHMWFTDIETGLHFSQRIWGWYPMFFDMMEGWIATP